MLPHDPDRIDPATEPPSAATTYESPPRPVTVAKRPRRRLPVLAIAVALVAVLAGGALFMSGYMLGTRRADQPGTPAADDAAFQPFWDAYRQIVDRYAGGKVDKDALIEGAIKGMFQALGDPYSSYLTPEDFQATLQGISGEFEGIGAEIGTVDAKRATSDCTELSADCRLVVVAPLDGSPAEKAGLRPGDIITAVDGVAIDGLSIDEARDKIRGRKGTEVKLSVDRQGEASPLVLTITRDVIISHEVTQKDLAGGQVGYVRLAGFSDNAAREFDAEIKKDIDAGRKKLIIDVRGNPGGYVTAARDVASEFVKDGPVFWQEDSKGKRQPTNATGKGVATSPDIKIVLLIDRGSASASEIVAGALKDTGRATLVGETTFGKGTVQEWTTLDGAGGIRLTVAKWLTPKQTWIHHVGIEPDVKIEVPADTPAGTDPVLDKALELLGQQAQALRPAA
jgi:carboxyl-terminal processing protease